MALIICPECGNKISEKAEYCIHCGLPKAHFAVGTHNDENNNLNYQEIKNMLIMFSTEWRSLFSTTRYIPKSITAKFFNKYSKYKEMLSTPFVQAYIKNNSAHIGFDIQQIQRFLDCLSKIYQKVDTYNDEYVNQVLIREKDYFDRILENIDKKVQLDDEQRRAVVTDEDYCLLVAGAGAGKTTTMAAKVKWLVEKQGVAQSDIIVISYTNKAIEELKDRIQKKLGFDKVNVYTFHSFGFDILRKTSETPPVVNKWAYKIIFECIEKAVFNNNDLLRKLVLFLGYYFDLPDENFNFKSLNDYCDFRALQDFETLKSRVGDYNVETIDKRTQKQRTIRGEYLNFTSEKSLLRGVPRHDILHKKENDTRIVYRIRYKSNPRQPSMFDTKEN